MSKQAALARVKAIAAELEALAREIGLDPADYYPEHLDDYIQDASITIAAEEPAEVAA
jgi:hypothetical protein